MHKQAKTENICKMILLSQAEFKARLKTAVEDSVDSKAEIALKTGVSSRTLDYWITGEKYLPDIKQLQLFAEATNKKVLWFYGLEPNESVHVQELQNEIKKLESERDSWRSQAELLRDLLKNQQNNK